MSVEVAIYSDLTGPSNSSVLIIESESIVTSGCARGSGGRGGGVDPSPVDG